MLVSLLGVASLSAHANPIFYEVENLVGDRWEYTYTLENSTADPIDWFTIYFDIGPNPSAPLHNNLQITGTPNADWDDPFFSFVADPDPFLPDDGFADFSSVGLAIDPGETLWGFSVAFDYFGLGTPGSQFFTINAEDPSTFAFVELSSGFTQPLVTDPPTGVPEPAPLALLGFGLLALLRRRQLRLS